MVTGARAMGYLWLNIWYWDLLQRLLPRAVQMAPRYPNSMVLAKSQGTEGRKSPPLKGTPATWASARGGRAQALMSTSARAWPLGPSSGGTKVTAMLG